MNGSQSARLSGRQAQAARNDALILAAARAVFTENPDAPISAVAERAGVGISALYRRYESKEELLRHLSHEGLLRYTAIVEKALADDGDPWEVFATYMREAMEADTHSLTLHLAGTFTPTAQLWQDGERAAQLNVELLERTKRAGALRPDCDVADMTLIFEQLAAINVGDSERTNQLRHRYLAFFLHGLRDTADAPLPGPAPRWEEITTRFIAQR